MKGIAAEVARYIDVPKGFKRIVGNCAGTRQTGNVLIQGDNLKVLQRLSTAFRSEEHTSELQSH